MACAVALALAGTLAGCGSSGAGNRVSAGRYVSSVCAALGPFSRAVATHAAALRNAGHETPAQGKSAIRGFFDAALTDSERLVTGIKRAGVPAVPAGSKFERDLVAAFERAHAAFQKADGQAAALPTSSPGAFRAAAAKLELNLQATAAGMTASFGRDKSPQLVRAAHQSTTCKSIGFG
jgi:hypothetical protein